MTQTFRPHGYTREHAHDEPAIRLNVLIACEESQAECIAFRELGHNAYSCDVQKCRKSGFPQWHINDDVTPYLYGKTTFTTQAGIDEEVPRWDLIIAHPPCTYLCKLSSLHLYKNADNYVIYKDEVYHVNYDRYNLMRKGRHFFLTCLSAYAPYVAVENPVPLDIAELPKADCFACPSWYGVKYTKKTLYWLRNLPPLMGQTYYPDAKSLVSSSRGKYRSRTFPQMAMAIAKQWSQYIINDVAQHGFPNPSDMGKYEVLRVHDCLPL